jgi:hypothetical protein
MPDVSVEEYAAIEAELEAMSKRLAELRAQLDAKQPPLLAKDAFWRDWKLQHLILQMLTMYSGALGAKTCLRMILEGLRHEAIHIECDDRYKHVNGEWIAYQWDIQPPRRLARWGFCM